MADVSTKATQQTLEKQRSEAQFQAQVKNFDAAIRYFQKQSYEKAEEIFRKLVEGPSPEVADRARVYLRLCNQKLDPGQVAPKTAEEHYTLGVTSLNSRILDSAIDHLNAADKLRPHQEHIQYALAAAQALPGNTDAALSHLKASISLRSENRFQARHDEDLKSLFSDPRFQQLLRSVPS